MIAFVIILKKYFLLSETDVEKATLDEEWPFWEDESEHLSL